MIADTSHAGAMDATPAGFSGEEGRGGPWPTGAPPRATRAGFSGEAGRLPAAAPVRRLRRLAAGAIMAAAATLAPQPAGWSGVLAAEPIARLELAFPRPRDPAERTGLELRFGEPRPSWRLPGFLPTPPATPAPDPSEGEPETGGPGAGGSPAGGPGGGGEGGGAAGTASGRDGPGGVPAIPAPGADLVIHYVQPSGFQKVTGRADQDLLLVSPDQPIDGRFQMDVRGFRGVYWIGATFDPAPAGWLTSPNGRRTEGVGTLVRIQTHKDAVRPFIVIGRMHLLTSSLAFGDFLQLGGDTRAGKWQAWPDVWRCRIIAEPLFGWRDYKGGSFSRYVSHSDFTKFETGGVRHSYAARIDATWGYQGEYVLPSHASDKAPYRGPDGRGTAQYWDYVARAVTDPAIGSEPRPKAFFLARGSDEVAAGDYITHRFDTAGRGVWIVPAQGAKVTDHIHPGGGAYAPLIDGGSLIWRNPKGDPFVLGRINDGGTARAPTVVGASEVGYRQRVTDRSALERALAGLCR